MNKSSGITPCNASPSRVEPLNQGAAKVHFSTRGSRYSVCFIHRFQQEGVLEAHVIVSTTLYTACRAICTAHRTFAMQSRLSSANSHSCTLYLPLLLFVISSHKCAPNLIFSYNKCIHTPCNISQAVISLHHNMSNLSPLYFSVSGERGAQCKSCCRD